MSIPVPVDNNYDFEIDDTVLVTVAQDPLAKLGAGIGSTVWDAGLCLAGFAYAAQQRQKLSFESLRNVLELGAGTGIAGLVFAKLGAQNVFLTDVPNCLPLMEHNICLNQQSDTVQALPLIWGDLTDIERIRTKIPLNDLDLIICSDLFAWPKLYQALLKTILPLAGPSTRILLAYEERDTVKEGQFFRMLHEHFNIREIDPSLMHRDYRARELHIFEAYRSSGKETLF